MTENGGECGRFERGHKCSSPSCDTAVLTEWKLWCRSCAAKRRPKATVRRQETTHFFRLRDLLCWAWGWLRGGRDQKNRAKLPRDTFIGQRHLPYQPHGSAPTVGFDPADSGGQKQP